MSTPGLQHVKPAMETLIDEMVQTLFQASEKRFVPHYPWVFCRVLQKEQQTAGGLVLPNAQNKTSHEGVVLATWPRQLATWFYNVNSNMMEKREQLSSSLKPGDHVLFPHWAGMPIEGYDKAYYRVVKECNWSVDKEGGIFATVERTGIEDSVRARVVALLKKKNLIDWETAEIIARVLQEQFILVDRDEASVTISGR